MAEKEELLDEMEELEQVDASAETENADNDQNDGNDSPGPVPYERFREVNEGFKETKKELEQLRSAFEEEKEAREEMRREELKKQEKYKELAEEYAAELEELRPAYKERDKEARELAKHVENFIEAQIEKVPEVYRDILLSVPLSDRIAWLSENGDKLEETKLKGVPKTPKGKRRGTLTEDEKRRAAARTF